MTVEHKSTQKMAANAEKGLALHDRFNRGGTEVGINRAKQIIAGGPLSDADVKSMHSYFARHEVDKDSTSQEWGDTQNPSAGYIAWLLWGGEEGKDWAARAHDKLAA